MAQAVQTGIVDLTGEDDNDNSIARAHAACDKAWTAASRLTSHFESMIPSRPVPFESSNDRVHLHEKDPLPAIAPKSLVHPRLGTFPILEGFKLNGLKKEEEKKKKNNNNVTRQGPSVPGSSVSFPQSALGIPASRPANSQTTLEKVEGNKRQPRETISVTPGAETSTIRTPRSAAISAKQNIAETCNELEEWVNKDPNLIPQQAGVGTPRKPGRPNKDSDEWSPSWNTKNNVEERKALGRNFSDSPIPSAGTHGNLTANEDNALSSIKGVSASLLTKKRKFSGSSQSRDSPVKIARWDEEPSAYHDSASSSLSEPVSRKHVHDGTVNSSPAGCFPKCVYPALKAAKAEYKQSLTEDEVMGIGRSVSFLSD